MIRELIEVNNYRSIVNDQSESIYIKFKRTLKVYLVLLIGLLIVGLAIEAVDQVVKNTFHLKSLVDINKTNFKTFFLKNGKVKAFLIACIFIPIMEEFLFRIWLDLKKNNIAIFFATIIFVVSGLKVMTLPPYVVFLIRIILSIGIFFLTRYLIKDVIFRVTIYQKQLIIASIILFGLAHISNYSPIYWKIIYLYPIYVLPQLLMGVGLTYTRLKSGIFWSIFLHCLINSISLLMIFHR
ncbi:membrane protease YdiL (CAAX protease family) [Pedobacter sp. UYP30]|uniref:CPBP family intramembrane glutamic endopeptidase n=1 Tax=Pedobacter sp. UYP30 TaxID=1756400 RepID=UPI003393373B